MLIFKRFVMFAVAMALFIQMSSTGLADHGEGLAWKHRVLVVFAPGQDSSLLTKQREILVGLGAGLQERDMVIVEIVDGKLETVLGRDLDVSASGLMDYLGKNDFRFEAVLFGKDTGVKLRSGEPVTANALFSLIDSMPMRRQEMRQGT